jgi:hypothetical protein
VSAESHIRQTPESPAIHWRGVAWAAIGSLLLLAGAIAGLLLIYQIAIPVKAPPPPQTFAQPRVDTQETEELHRLVAAQRKRLETWAWANAPHTLAQIPIERAMRLLAQQGVKAYAPLLPPQPTLSSPTAGAQNAATPSEAPLETQP